MNQEIKMRLAYSAPSFVFSLDTNDTAIVHEIQDEAAAAAGRSEYRRAVCLGQERLSGSALKGKAASYGASYATKRREAYALLAAAAAKRGFEIVDVIDADRFKCWGLRRKA